MSKLMNKLMLSCKKATELIEKKRVTSLGRMERIQLAMHKSMCKVCSAYEIQSEFLEKAMDRHYLISDYKKEEQLSDEAKKKIIEKLAKH